MKQVLSCLIVLVIGCAATEPNRKYYELNSGQGWKAGVLPDDLENYVSWKNAIDVLLLNPINVEAVGQGHSLQVNIVFKDDSYIQTIEPDIDTIFLVLDKCGKPCAHILQITE